MRKVLPLVARSRRVIDLAGDHWKWQPRDPEGKWIDTGGALRTIVRYTKRLMDKANTSEPAITGALKKHRGTGQFEGLKYRFKGAGSMTRKIATKAQNDFDGDVDKAASSISDAIRYTLIYDTASMAAEADKTLEGLKRDGFKVAKIKNHLGSTPGPMGYRGVNMKMVAPDGHPFELQFHTRESFDAKMGKGHEIYEKYRVLDPGSPEAARLEKESVRFYSQVPQVPGIETLG